jgi:hypothetical protein
MAYGAGDTKFAVKYSSGDANFVATFAASCNAGATMAERAEAGAQMFGITDGPAKSMSNEITFDECEAFDLNGLLMSGINDFSTADLTQGTHSNGMAPVNVCLVWTLQTAAPGRSHRGRMYLGGADYGRMGSDRARWDVSGDFPGSAAAFLAAGDGTMGAVTPLLCVNSRTLQELNPVTNIRVNTYLGTQRRRAEAFE